MLYLWMPEGQGDWLWCTNGGTWQSAPSVEALIQAVNFTSTSKDAMVFFPSQTAQFDVKPLPRAQYKQLGVQGIHYLLEENSIDAIDHLAIFHHYAQNELHMMAMSKQTRETYQYSLSLLPWHIQALLPDFLIIDTPEAQTLKIMQIHDRTVWRWGEYRGWQSSDLSLIDLWQDPEQKIQVAGLSSLQMSQLADALKDSSVLATKNVDELSADLSKIKNHPFNALLKVKKPSQQSHYWRACAALFVVALSVQVLYDGLRWWKYKKIADQTSELAINQYKQWFPNDGRINEQNLTTQFDAKIRANATADVQVLQLISRVGPILQQANIAAQQVKYQENSLSLHLLTKNAENLKNLTEQFKQQGFSAELGAIQNQGNDVIGIIKVQ